MKTSEQAVGRQASRGRGKQANPVGKSESEL